MRKTLIAIGMLLLMPLSLALAQGGGNGNAMSPVGAWDFTLAVDGEPPFQKTLVVYNFGGTMTASPASEAVLTNYGSWERTGSRSFVSSSYIIIPDETTGEHVGYIKVRMDYLLVDKDTIEGRSEVWFLVGTDPFHPLDVFFVGAGDDVGRRLKAEGPP